MMSVDWNVLDLNNVSQPAERHGLKTLWLDLQKEVSVMVLSGECIVQIPNYTQQSVYRT